MLVVSGIGKTFGKFVALRDVTMVVNAGTIHAVIGPNGAGKTTLINTISGLIKPDAGTIYLGDTNLTRAPAHSIARAGLVRTFQITSLFSELSVLDNVKVSLNASRKFRGAAIKSESIPSAASGYLAQFGLERIAERIVGQLSHGDQRILEIAVALAAKPEMILLDEPTAGMSPDETERFTNLLSSTLRGKITLVLVEHDMDVVLRTADRITVLAAGTILADDTPANIMANASVQEAYLGRSRH